MNPTSTNIYNFKQWISETDPAKLSKVLSAFLDQSGYTTINFIDHYFPIQGYTCLWLLGESHLAVHTFPENGETYVELSGCNEKMNSKFSELFFKNFTIVREQALTSEHSIANNTK